MPRPTKPYHSGGRGSGRAYVRLPRAAEAGHPAQLGSLRSRRDCCETVPSDEAGSTKPSGPKAEGRATTQDVGSADLRLPELCGAPHSDGLEASSAGR